MYINLIEIDKLSPVCLHRVELLLETTNVVRDQQDAENASNVLFLYFSSFTFGYLFVSCVHNYSDFRSPLDMLCGCVLSFFCLVSS